MVTLSATGFSDLPVADSGDLVSNLPVADSGDLLSNLPVADSGGLVGVLCWSVIDNFGFLFK